MIKDSGVSGDVKKVLFMSPEAARFSPVEENAEHPSRDIPLIFSNLVQFEGCTRKQHRAVAQKIRENPGAYQSSSTAASQLTLSETLYLAQVVEMWAHMSKEHRHLFVEMVVVESSLSRLHNLRTCGMSDARALLKQDVEFYELSDQDLNAKIEFIRSQSPEEMRALMTSSVKCQAYYLPWKPVYLVIDKFTCGYTFALFCFMCVCISGWLLLQGSVAVLLR